ncbi:hypothetical protein PRIC2_007579 [Phytophthora ramorum]
MLSYSRRAGVIVGSFVAMVLTQNSIASAASVVTEGNYFDSVKTPNQPDPDGNLFVPAAAGDCQATIGRDCELNVLTDSGTFSSNLEDAAKTQISTYKTQIGGLTVTGASKLSVASDNFGVGALDTSSVAQTSGSGGVVATSTDSSAATQGTEAPSVTAAAQETSTPATTELPSTDSSASAATDASSAQESASTEATEVPAMSGSGSEATESPTPATTDTPATTEAPSTEASSASGQDQTDTPATTEAPSTEAPSATDCQASIGRDCEVNVLTDSGTFASNSEDAATQQIGAFKTQIGGTKVAAAAQVSAATGNFGVGELGSDSVTQQATTTGSSDAQGTMAPTATQSTQETTAPTTTGSSSSTDAPQATNAPVATTVATSTDIPLGTVKPYADDSASGSSVLQWGHVTQTAASTSSDN